MKILQIRFQNLNSLAGEWGIDFTHPDYTANGIFAITGPTGSGKTTLLDAICLALYGRTPRLDRISETTNEIMSRHTGLCFSEVVFETNKGRFLCHWSQRRARQQSTGKLQSPRHEIVDNRTGKVLESRIKNVARMVEEVTGMDFDQLTRSVLLAQGGFTAFLQASSDERAPILEQITGTEIYSRLSRKVHQRKGEEQHQLALLEAETSAVTLLTAEEEEALKADLADKKKNSEEILTHLHTTQTGLSWLTNLSTLKKDIAALEAETEDISRLLQEAEPEKIRLERAKMVRRLDGNYRQVCRMRARQELEGAEKEKARQERQNVGQQQKEMLIKFNYSEILLNTENIAYRQESAVCKEVRELDIKLQETRNQTGTILREKEAAENEKQIHDRLMQGIQTSIAEKRKTMDKSKEYLLQHRKDAGLLEDLAGVQELVKGVVSLVQKDGTLGKETQKARKTVQDTEKKALQLRQTHQKNDKALAEANSMVEIRQQEVTNLLAGLDPAVLREDLEQLTERRHTVDKIGQLARQLAGVQGELRSNTAMQRQTAAHLEEHVRKRQALAEKIALQRQVVEKQEQIVLLANRIRDYDEERAHLMDGSPCPLCGATDHPYVTASAVRLDEVEPVLRREKEALLVLQTEDAHLLAEIATSKEKYEQAWNEKEKLLIRLNQEQDAYARLTGTLPFLPEDIETELIHLDTKRQQGKIFLQDVEQKIRLADTARKEAELAKDIYNQSLQETQKAAHAVALAAEHCKHKEDEARTVAEELRKSLDHASLRILPYGVTDLTVDSCSRIIADLACRQQKWRQQKEQEEEALAQLQALQIDLEREMALVQKQVTEIDRINGQIQLKYDQLATLQKSRHERYGDKSPDREEKRMADRRSEAENNLAKMTQNLHKLEKYRAVLDERIGTLTQSIADQAEQLVREEQNFLLAISDQKFIDEKDFNSARLTDKCITEIAGVMEKLTIKETEIKTLLQSKKETLTLESRKELTTLCMADLTRRIEEKTAALHELQQQIGMLQGRLRNNEEQRKKQYSRQEALEQQRQECRRWQRLHELIGSSDGKKFRNFAQGVTFEMMVGHANRSLKKMTDRYILIRDTLQPLELNVIDNYQAGEIRSTKNLSGGESFIVSLALALGLARMASKNVQVDSLFLDEGFGALDEDSLQTALETLAGLQQDGKIIGIISHVPALQERIATRIQVTPGPAGRSRLQGPGITQG
jgi:DNA repair protein SbcC/Rad50